MANFFNKNLKNVRLAKNISQQKLADMVKTDRSNISRWENGEVEIPLDIAYSISKALNINFVDMVSEDLIESGELETYLDNETLRLKKQIENISSITPKGKEMLLNTLDYVKDDSK